MSSRIDCPSQLSAYIFIQHFGGREPLKHFHIERLTAGLCPVRVIRRSPRTDCAQEALKLGKKLAERRRQTLTVPDHTFMIIDFFTSDAHLTKHSKTRGSVLFQPTIASAIVKGFGCRSHD